MANSLVKQVQYLKENGFTEQQANTLVYFHKDSISDEMATKKDIAGIHREIELLRAEFKKDIEILRKDLTLKLGSIMVTGVVILGVLIQFN